MEPKIIEFDLHQQDNISISNKLLFFVEKLCLHISLIILMRFVSTFNVHLALSSKEELCGFVQLITTSSAFVSILITTVAKKLKSSVLCVCQGIRF